MSTQHEFFSNLLRIRWGWPMFVRNPILKYSNPSQIKSKATTNLRNGAPNRSRRIGL